MRGEKRIHKGFEVWTPPLRQSVSDLPLAIDTFAGKLGANGSESFIQAGFEAFDLVIFRKEIVAWPSEIYELLSVTWYWPKANSGHRLLILPRR